jgi:VWFA-related protein
MKTLLLSIIAATLFSLSAIAQVPKETPKTNLPSKNDDDVVVVNTTLIQIDVTVTDKKGKIVTDLKKEDFEIFENKAKQDISNFSFVQSEIKPQTAKIPEKNSTGNVGIPIPPTKIRPESVKRTIALVVDDLTLSFESVYQVRRSLKKFLDEQMQEGDLVAIIRTGGGIGALQQFTYDKQQLYAAIEKVKWNPNGTGKIGAFAPIEPSLADFQKNANPNMSDEDYQAAKNQEKEFQQNRDNYFVAGTLGALNFVIKGMKELPGRKSVMLLSDGFSLTQTDSSGFKEFSVIRDALQNLIETANRSSVVIYSVDARGLQTLGITAADSTSDLTQEQITQQSNDRRDTLSETQDTLRYLAQETGGLAVVNSNDLGKGIQRMLNDQAGYYLIGYQPDDSTFDAAKRKFNKLLVKVNRPGLVVRYRSGFFGVPDEEAKAPSNAVQSVSNQILSAIASPFQKNDIVLNLNAMFGSEAKRGSFVRSFLHIDPKGLKFTQAADGKQATSFDILAVTFGDNGVTIDQVSKHYSLSINKESFADFNEKGFIYNIVSWIAKPGAYQMRVVLRDSETGRIGSASQFIEVPNLKKNRLTLSSLLLVNHSETEWKESQTETTSKSLGNPMTDTALRRFKQNTVLGYGFEIYNAKLASDNKLPDLEAQIRVFRDGKIILSGDQRKITFAASSDFSRPQGGGAIAFGKTMEKGDYVLQVVVTDRLAKIKNQTASQWIAFEIY